MGERIILTVMTALVSGSWAYYFAVMLRGPSVWQWLTLPIAALFGAVTWIRYAGGHTTEAVFAEEVPQLLRVVITLGMTIAGLVGGFVLPTSFGSNDAALPLELALALTFALVCGWIAWNHPTLFYKNRRF
jgi:hypothetical protein